MRLSKKELENVVLLSQDKTPDEILLDQLDELYHKRYDKPLADMMMASWMKGTLKGIIGGGGDTPTRVIVTCLRKEIAKYSEHKAKKYNKEPELITT